MNRIISYKIIKQQHNAFIKPRKDNPKIEFLITIANHNNSEQSKK